MAKIAVKPETSTDLPISRILARGDGWTASDIVCSSGPFTPPFEERHARPAIALVVGGTFQYRSGAGHELMTPGSVLLGNPGQHFECAHEHGIGDRCLSFSYAPEFFDRLAADAGWAGKKSRTGTERGFQSLRLPPIPALSPLAVWASAALAGSAVASWDEFAIKAAAKAIQLDHGIAPGNVGAQPGAAARVSRIVRMIEAHPEERHDLGKLAEATRLSPYHFLRTFEGVMGVTPHQYLLRMRLQRAAIQFLTGPGRILDIALDSGFGDVSNFNRTFRAEFGASPRAYRMQFSQAVQQRCRDVYP